MQLAAILTLVNKSQSDPLLMNSITMHAFVEDFGFVIRGILGEVLEDVFWEFVGESESGVDASGLFIISEFSVWAV